MKAITDSLMDTIFVDTVGVSMAKSVMDHASRYETLMMTLIAENEHLKGRLEMCEAGVRNECVAIRSAAVTNVGTTSVTAAPVAVVPVAAAAVKATDTWACVVKASDNATSEEVVKKVVKEVCPSLGVRVHDVKPLRKGGAVIRTPSLAEREKIKSNVKFAEVGLKVAVNDKLGPRVVIQRVHSEITTDEFMEELYDLNLKDVMNRDEFKKSSRLITSPWKSVSDATVNVILECSEKVAEKLCFSGAYIKWFRFAARIQDDIPACYRCFSFDHRVGECRKKEATCQRCVLEGHVPALTILYVG